ncbi:MAG: response regulator transcription factor [Clostridia bacterium]|nr:response regulator transcription factor [Clostridia bacterium]
MAARILVVEDDDFLREGMTELLGKEGYTVSAVSNIAQAGVAVRDGRFELLLLDVMLPDGSGFDFCEKIRADGSRIPILFITACDDELQIVRGLDAGADDYVTKPFKLRELLSRIRALLRRSGTAVYESRGVLLDRDRMTVKRDGETIFLTPTEFQILSVLIRNSGIIVTRGQLLDRIWDNDGNFIDDNTLSVHISRLREKIGGAHIVTVRGVGYRWEDAK